MVEASDQKNVFLLSLMSSGSLNISKLPFNFLYAWVYLTCELPTTSGQSGSCQEFPFRHAAGDYPCRTLCGLGEGQPLGRVSPAGHPGQFSHCSLNLSRNFGIGSHWQKLLNLLVSLVRCFLWCLHVKVLLHHSLNFFYWICVTSSTSSQDSISHYLDFEPGVHLRKVAGR